MAWYARCEEGGFADQNLLGVWAAFCVAQEVGAQLGRGEVLQ
jgi:hypothetical protein